MPFTLTMPKLSPTMEEGTIAKWHKKEGDFVKAGDVLFEVATDKATVEHAALDSGYLRKIIIKDGGSAIVNQAVAIFTEKKDENIEGYKPEGDVPKTAIQAPASAPKETSTAKAPTSAGVAQPAFKPEPPLKGYHFTQATAAMEAHVPASPLAKKLAKEKGIDLSTVKGTGPGHRIVSRDLDLGQPNVPVTFGRHEVPTIAPGAFEEEMLTPMRKVIASKLQASKSFIPHFYITMEIRCEKLLDVRQQLQNLGLRVSVNDLVIRSIALALRQHPEMNSGFDSEEQKIIRFKTIDISVAVTIPDGLITPIVRHADFKNVGEISAEIKMLAHKAKEGKLTREEYTGGSFTISNLGMYGVSDFIAVINPPQAAILAVSAILDKPVVQDHQVVPGKLMSLTLSSDHRVIDGVAASLFLKTVQRFLEQPAGLLL
ncbi:MAG: pyruvate dehydrogenase complex dihydrolipoamide acetyltransferase [Rhabdochlamydiaceae bacterium]